MRGGILTNMNINNWLPNPISFLILSFACLCHLYSVINHLNNSTNFQCVLEIFVVLHSVVRTEVIESNCVNSEWSIREKFKPCILSYLCTCMHNCCLNWEWLSEWLSGFGKKQSFQIRCWTGVEVTVMAGRSITNWWTTVYKQFTVKKQVSKIQRSQPTKCV